MSDLDPLSADGIRAGLTTEFVGRSLFYMPEVASTNDEARHLARAGAPEGTLVITDYQRSGRGRLDRRWEAPPRTSLLLSLIFHPRLAPAEVQRLTMICGLAVADAVESETGLRVGLKWPNDIVIDRAKAGGILTEIELAGDRLDFAVVGLGLNVNLEPSGLPAGLLMPATSLAQALGRKVARLPLLWTLLARVEERYEALQAGHSPHGEWVERLITLGQSVVVSASGSVVGGVAEGVDDNGALLVRRDDGQLETVMAGDVTLRAGGQSGPA